MTDSTKFTAEHMIPVQTANGRRIKVTFSASTSDSLPWSFRPLQREISLLPGETALAFYKARNKSDEDIIGIATYNVNPAQVAPYFNKIQCFCFEEQKLAAGEEVFLSVLLLIRSICRCFSSWIMILSMIHR
jgi:cytochrome c oxidase assembly protein subunit 11